MIRSVPYLRVANVQRGYLDLTEVKEIEASESEIEALKLQPGDILFNEGGDRDKLGRGWIWNGELTECVHQNHVFRARLKNSEDQPKFISFYGNSEGQRYFMEQGKQTTNLASINLTKLGALPIPLPPPDDQRRIVAEIEKQFTRLEAGVAALRRIQANLKRYRASVLAAACAGQLVPTEADLQQSRSGVPPLDLTPGSKPSSSKQNTEAASKPKRRDAASTYESGEQLLKRILTERRQQWTGRGLYKEPAALDTTNLPPLPEGWTWASVEQLLREPLCNGMSVKGSDNPPGVRALRLSAMSNSGFDYSDARYLPLSEDDVDDLWIQQGDFFMSRGNGSLHLVGRGTSAQKPPHPTIFPDTMIRLRLADVVRISGWVRTLWPSRSIRSQIESRVKTTAGIYKIAQPQVEGMTIPLPPLAEQTRIVAEVERRLSVVEELEASVTTNLQRATRLR